MNEKKNLDVRKMTSEVDDENSVRNSEVNDGNDDEEAEDTYGYYDTDTEILR